MGHHGYMFVLCSLMSLAACQADTTGERVAGTALLGGAMGIPAGPIGIAAGAGIGAVAGAVIPKGSLAGDASARPE